MKFYKHILSPVKVGGLVLKNRFVSSDSLPHFLQGSELFPNDQVINHVVSQAKNGAAVVTFADWTNPNQRTSFNEDGRRVVVVGGSESGTEAGLYLAENGHDATVITRQALMAPDATPIHYREVMDEYIAELSNFSTMKKAVTTETGEGYVEYLDKDGAKRRIECDDAAALGSMRPMQEEAMAFYGIARETYMIGDCREVGCVRDCTRLAFAVASRI